MFEPNRIATACLLAFALPCVAIGGIMVDNARPLIEAGADMFVMPSLWEGLPLSMVLAMGAGLPVVATSVAGIPEVVSHDVNGLLVPPADAPALGAALAQLVRNPELRMQLGAAAREWAVPRFGVDGYVASVTALYDRLLVTKQLA